MTRTKAELRRGDNVVEMQEFKKVIIDQTFKHSMKGDSQKGMKRCLIALVFAVVLMAVVTIAALALACSD